MNETKTAQKPGSWCMVEYLDAVHGGSGSTRMHLRELPGWLKSRPGVLIRAIRCLDGEF